MSRSLRGRTTPGSGPATSSWRSTASRSTDAVAVRRLVADAKIGTDRDAQGAAKRPARWTSRCRSSRARDRRRQPKAEAQDCGSSCQPHATRYADRRLVAFQPRLELLERLGSARTGAASRSDHHFGRLVAVARHADDDRFVGRDDAALDRDRSCAASVVPPAGSVKMPSVSAEQLNRVDDLRRRTPPRRCRRSLARTRIT